MSALLKGLILAYMDADIEYVVAFYQHKENYLSTVYQALVSLMHSTSMGWNTSMKQEVHDDLSHTQEELEAQNLPRKL